MVCRFTVRSLLPGAPDAAQRAAREGGVGVCSRGLHRRALCTALAVLGAAPGVARAGEPTRIKDIRPGETSSEAREFTPLGPGQLFFRADDGVHGFELWRTDGTPAGTALAVDLREGDPNGFPANLVSIGAQLFFTAYDTPLAEGSKVFVSDGTAAGTQLLTDTYPGLPSNPAGPPLPDDFTPLGSQVLFTATDPEAGHELWRTDGTPAGTARVIDLHPGTEWSLPVDLTEFDGVVYFAADDSVIKHPDGSATYDRELFRSDGTAQGTFRVKDIYPGPEPSVPGELTPFRSSLYFAAVEPGFGRELWKTDGTEGGTVRVSDIWPGAPGGAPEHVTVFGQQLVFSASDGRSGVELWRSDGTASGTQLLKDIHPSGDSLPLDFEIAGQRLFFNADDGANGRELWVSDGTALGTRLVRDIVPGAESSAPGSLTALGSRVWFTVVRPTGLGDGSVLSELWRSDGSAEGTALVWRAPGRSGGYAISELRALGDQLLFVAPSSADADGISTDYELHGVSAASAAAPGF
jgi:ELWxxDGT repeat protein